jgi:cation diffusion facilitator family transporter
MASSSKTVVYAALAGNLLVAATKAIAAAVTGSSAMLSEAIHSCVDTGNELLLLYGMRRSNRGPDRAHPLGYGRELYFWSFVVALLVFAVGAGVSFYEGVVHLRHPEPIERPIVNYVVLGLSFLFEGYSFRISLRQFRANKGEQSYWQAVVRSKDPPQFIVLLEDSAALIGLAIAGAGTTGALLLDDPRLDGIASIAIGLLLGLVAILLARESKGLLIGEQADPALAAALSRIALADEGVARVNGVLTVQLSPQDVVAALSLEFHENLRIVEVEKSVAALEAAIRAERPEISRLFVKPQPASGYAAARQVHTGDPAPQTA